MSAPLSLADTTPPGPEAVERRPEELSPLTLPTSLDEGQMVTSPPAASVASPPIPALQCSPTLVPEAAVQQPAPVDDYVVREFVSVVVNGLQVVQCDAPQAMPGAKSTGSAAVEPRTLMPMAVGAGGAPVRIHLVASAHNILLQRDASVKIRVVFSGADAAGRPEHSVDLGELTSRMDSFARTETLPFVPTQVMIEVVFHALAAKRDSEQVLVETLREIIADEHINPRGGSILASLADDTLRQRTPELYAEVVQQRFGGLQQFLERHKDVFTHFTFSDRALKKKTVSPEPRIVLKPGQREMCTTIPMTPAERRLHQYLTQILGREDIDKRDLLDLLSNDTGFANFLSPTLSILMRFLSRHKDVFVWSMDPDKPTVVGLQGRQHDSASLGQQASLDKAMGAPAAKRWGSGGGSVPPRQPPSQPFTGIGHHRSDVRASRPGPGRIPRGGGPGWPGRQAYPQEQQVQVIEYHQQVPPGQVGQQVVQQPQHVSQLPPHLQQLIGNIGPNQQVIVETVYTDQLPPDVAASVGAGGGIVVYEDSSPQALGTEQMVVHEVRGGLGGAQQLVLQGGGQAFDLQAGQGHW
eukprot:TRINITY_DN3029_c0_g2_i1.p1 TRINITY_DN3029_c0_g2~~TRINITY_DN3029_c0_g2_i1.p1  ORF type:complete len:614 (+),score=158.53 TRINITY_DN3029_c0_g2_i1:101-1843(+)